MDHIGRTDAMHAFIQTWTEMEPDGKLWKITPNAWRSLSATHNLHACFKTQRGGECFQTPQHAFAGENAAAFHQAQDKSPTATF
jgi:hypothetical protein